MLGYSIFSSRLVEDGESWQDRTQVVHKTSGRINHSTHRAI